MADRSNWLGIVASVMTSSVTIVQERVARTRHGPLSDAAGTLGKNRDAIVTRARITEHFFSIF